MSDDDYDDYGLGLKVHEDAYRELEEELAKAKSKLEEVGFRACCVLLERDEAREQRDRLAGALFMCRRELVYVLDDINKERVSHDGDDFHEALRISKEALAAVKGGPQ
jgi:hypothetical protein